MVKQIKQSKGFTLVELLIVIAVMAILMAVVFVALNPLARFQDTRNSKRWTDVNAIISAIKLQQVDNQGNFLASINSLATGTYYMIGTGAAFAGTCPNTTISGMVDITPLETNGYLAKIPVDPTGGTTWTAAASGYYLNKNANGTLIIGSCGEEEGSAGVVKEIEVQR